MYNHRKGEIFSEKNYYRFSRIVSYLDSLVYTLF